MSKEALGRSGDEKEVVKIVSGRDPEEIESFGPCIHVHACGVKAVR